jgi:hypothetical protein
MSYINCELKPSNTTEAPWLHERNAKRLGEMKDVGKWMLFCKKDRLDGIWEKAKGLYREDKLKGVSSMKCSTNFENPRASSQTDGIIILYCNYSKRTKHVMDTGKRILKQMQYADQDTIYYKTDVQTKKGTRNTGSKVNHSYKLDNPNCKSNCMITDTDDVLMVY